MKITWLGQSGYRLQSGSGEIIIDPYLSDAVERVAGRARMVAAPIEPENICADAVICTHDHLDHTDPETLRYYLGEDTSVLVLASYNAWQTVRKLGGLQNNYVMFNRKTRWTEGMISFEAVYAEHSDDHAIGILISAEGKTWYITGDTLYNEKVFADLPKQIDYVFLPVNGRGNNMNMTDAAAFCRRLGAVAIPLHCGLFDDMDLCQFPYEKKIVPLFYKEIDLREEPV